MHNLGPSPDLLNQSVHFKRTSRRFVSTLEYENPWTRCPVQFCLNQYDAVSLEVIASGGNWA